jgi:hypothetical protein
MFITSERKKSQLRVAILALEKAVEEKAFKGARDPMDRDALEHQYTMRKQIVLKIIREL